MDPITKTRSNPASDPVPDFPDPVHAEWLETDGRFGFACSTVSLCPSRRYHGLLIAPLPGGAKRYLFVAGFDERVTTVSSSVALSPRRLRGDPRPACAAFAGFEPRPWPRFRFRHGPLAVTREILMSKGSPTVLVRYGVTGGTAILRLRPRLPVREADALTFRNDVLRPGVERLPGGLRCRPYDALPPVTIGVAAFEWEFTPAPDWDEGVEYEVDLARGYDGHEDLFSPGVITVRLSPGASVCIATTVGAEVPDPGALWESAAADRRVPTGLRDRCAVAADDFLYSTGARRGVIAGFPWFGEWGRDTFLALPGLTLARDDLAGCAEVLTGALPYLDDGLLPNIFGTDKADSHYGSVDAALWFARAVLLYQRAGGEVQPYLPALREIADAYAAGTAPRIAALGIGSDASGLIHAGDEELNPTWMDAKPASGAVTPRHGCPVEINALWYSLLAFLAEATGEERFGREAHRVGAAFVERFWLPERAYLADVWRPDRVDASVRPNMVLAASLELSPLTVDQRAGVLARVDAELLTPVGLRTLSPDHPDYEPRYDGGVEERDRAYHQGTVWPWLLGCYCELALRVDPGRSSQLRELFGGLESELSRAGLEHVSEVFDGDPPHRPGGTFAQAWNTAEILRALALLDTVLQEEG